MTPAPGARMQLFAPGTRVRVPGPVAGWRVPCVGRVVGDPEEVATRQGPDLFYWIAFDSPQHDLSNDGPYISAQILSCYLSAAPEEDAC